MPLTTTIKWALVLMAAAGTAAILSGCGLTRPRGKSGPAPNGSLELAHNGKTEYIIVQSTHATPAEHFAAQDLRAFLKKATGAEFAIVPETNRPLPAKAIYVGWTAYAAQCVPLASLGEEEWVVQTRGCNLVLTGGRPRGTLYAVYEFLEQQVGCRWLDEVTEIVPAKPDLKLEPLDVRGKPAFWDRKIYTSTEGPLTDLFNVRNKDTRQTGAKYGYGVHYGSPSETHTLHYYAKAWPTNHPLEYLAMTEHGERPRALNSRGPGQVCLTHPEVRRLMLDTLRGYIAADREKAAKTGAPPPRIYAIESNDNPLSCQCPACKAFSEREAANAGPFLDMVNFLADGVREAYPDVLVDTFAYLQTLAFPKTVRPQENVLIRIAQLNAFAGMNTNAIGYKMHDRPDYFRPMSHPVNRSCLDRFLSWAQNARHMAYWDYWAIYTDPYMTPYINLACIKPDLELFLDNHVEMMFVESEYADSSSFYALKRWVGLKLMQDPRQPVEPLVATFMSGYYGPAASTMKAYLTYLEKRIAEFTDTEKLSFVKAKDRPYLDLDFFVTSQRLLDEAEALCATNPAARFHVQRERSPVDSGLLGGWESLRAKLTPGQALPFDRSAVIRRYKVTRMAQIEAMPSWPYKGQDKARNKLKKELAALEEAAQLETRKREKPPVMHIPRLPQAATQGDPASIEWSRAAAVGQWRTLGGGYMKDRQVKGDLAHDGTYLYVRLEESLHPHKLAVDWNGDSWQLYFAGRRGKAPYRYLAIYPDGRQVANEYGAHAEVWQSPWKTSAMVKNNRGNGHWQVHVAIPLAEVIPGGVTPDRPFYANIIRYTSNDGEFYGMSLAWSPPFRNQFSNGGGFHDLSRLSKVTLD